VFRRSAWAAWLTAEPSSRTPGEKNQGDEQEKLDNENRPEQSVSVSVDEGYGVITMRP
jgi:hypothetical protein